MNVPNSTVAAVVESVPEAGVVVLQRLAPWTSAGRSQGWLEERKHHDPILLNESSRMKFLIVHTITTGVVEFKTLI